MGRKDLLIEEIFLNETQSAAHASEVTADDMDKIRKSNSEILAQYPASAVEQAVRAKMAGNKAKSAQSGGAYVSRFRVRVSYITAAAAAAVLLAVALPVLRMNGVLGASAVSGFEAENIMGYGTERVKGAGALLKVYRSENGKAVRLKTRDYVKEGDTLQLSYVAAGQKYGIIFSVDGNGVLTQHLPETGASAAKLETGGEIPLRFSYKLDDAPDFERFVLVTSAKPFSIPVLETESAAVNDISSIIPPSARSTDVLLLK